MKGLLADVNIQGLVPDLRIAFQVLGFTELLDSLGLDCHTFPDLGLDRHMKDRPLWNFCQENGLVLLTDNRNHEDEDSLQATLNDSLTEQSLPVLTPGSKERFLNDSGYRTAVAKSVMEVLFGIAAEGLYLGVGRLFVPLPNDL